MTWMVSEVPTEMATDCQKERKMTSLIAKTFRKGCCGDNWGVECSWA